MFGGFLSFVQSTDVILHFLVIVLYSVMMEIIVTLNDVVACVGNVAHSEVLFAGN